MMKLFVTRALVLLLWYAGAAYPQSEAMWHWGYGRFAELEKAAQAQIKVRGAHPHPFFWAAFQLTGRDDWRLGRLHPSRKISI